MNKPLIALGAVVLVVIVAALMAMGAYNKLVALQEETDSSWAQVENVYQRRADLIPNLVATVSGAADFEKSTLTEVTDARASVGQVKLEPGKAPADAAALQQYEQAQAGLSGALSRLLVVAERYPTLRATAGFRDLQTQLEGAENRISVERGRFNEAVKSYNVAIKSFPAMLFAGSLGFEERPFFSSKPGSDTPPEVNFGNKPQTEE